MKAWMAVTTVALALVVGACGGDDESDSASSGAQGVEAPEGPKAATSPTPG